MKEMLDYYSKDGEHLGSMEKKRMHQLMIREYKKKGKITIRHKDVKLILMTSKGRIVLQRRSKWKGSNSGMWDKTVGGHVQSEDVPDLSMLKECSEELGIPATIVDNKDFLHAVATTDLRVLGILTKLVYLDNFQSSRTDSKGKKWIEPSMTQFYIGYYDGTIKFIDSESCGIQVFTANELTEEMKSYPKSFTDDMKYIMKKFNKHLKPAPRKVKHVLND